MHGIYNQAVKTPIHTAEEGREGTTLEAMDGHVPLQMGEGGEQGNPVREVVVHQWSTPRELTRTLEKGGNGMREPTVKGRVESSRAENEQVSKMSECVVTGDHGGSEASPVAGREGGKRTQARQGKGWERGKWGKGKLEGAHIWCEQREF